MKTTLICSILLQISSFAHFVTPSPTPRASNTTFPRLLDATLDDLRIGLDAGHFTSVDLVAAYLARIDETNKDLAAVTEINPDAISIAEKLDAERESGVDLSSRPLHGIPVLLKNNMATNDRMDTSAGSYALLGAKVSKDSTVAAKLRHAGAVILGKANLSEWAACRELVSHEGWSAHGGQTLGAYFPGQNPRGSSSGSAVAASIGLAWASVGTDTGGSILLPGHANNVVGFRPTVGLTSRHLVVPWSERQDTVGTMTRTVKDAAYLMKAIAGVDKNDNYTEAIPFKDIPDYVAACTSSGLKGKRLGVSRNMLARNIDVTAHTAPEEFEKALDILRDAGAEIVDNVYMGCADALPQNGTTTPPTGPVFSIPGADFLVNFPEYLSHLKTNPNNITSVEDLRAFTRKHPREGYSVVDTGNWDNFLEIGVNNTAPEFWNNVTLIEYILGPYCFTGAMEEHKLDAMVMPTPYSVLTAAGLGFPVVTVPLGKAPADAPVVPSEQGRTTLSAPNGPFGISFAGMAFSEESLFGMAYAFEQRTKVREKVKPYKQPRTELADIVGK